jgi:hypothetical protein
MAGCPHWVILILAEVGVTRFAQPHVHMYMFCSYVISTLYGLLEELQMRTSKRYFFLCNSSQNFTPKIKELRYHFSLSQLYFIGHKLPVPAER